MKNIKKIILTAGIVLITTFSYSQTYTANVGVVKQEQDQWCWAADSKCILDYYGIVKSQCTIVEYARSIHPTGYFGTQNCCPKTASCNKPNEIKYDYGIMGMLAHFGQLKSEIKAGPMPVSRITSELKAKRPFVIGIFWNGGGGHVVVGCGYNQTTGSITFMDSWQNNGMTTKKYTGGNAFSTNSGSGNWHEFLALLSSPLGISDAADLDDRISIYPNPSEGVFTINTDIALKSVNIFNTTGQLVKSYTAVTDQSLSVKIPDAGFYTVQMATEKGIVNKKMVVQ